MALHEILQCYWNLYSSMLRRAMKTILGANRIRISQRIRIFSWEFQNIVQWLPKSRKHVQIKSRDRKCPFFHFEADSDPVPGRPNRVAPFDSSRNSTQKTFFMIFSKILIWHELSRITAGFRNPRWILFTLLDSSWNSVQDMCFRDS